MAKMKTLAGLLCSASLLLSPALADAQISQTAIGVPGTGFSQPSGGVGLLGYLSGIYHALTNTLTVNIAASSVNGWSTKLLNGLSNTAVAVKTGGAQVGMLQCYNPNATQEYVQIYNIASGSVTVGVSAPSLSIPIAPTSSGGFAGPVGGQFSTAVSVAATTTAMGGTAPGTALDCNMLYL